MTTKTDSSTGNKIKSLESLKYLYFLDETSLKKWDCIKA